MQWEIRGIVRHRFAGALDGLLRGVAILLRRGAREILVRPVISALYLALAAALCVFPLAIVSHIDRGIDVSDAGYYHTSLSEFSNINMSVTQFGPVWNLLPAPDSVVGRRVAMMMLVAGSAAWLFLEAAFTLVKRGRFRSLFEQVLVGVAGASAAMLYARLWLLDPNYNTLALWLSCMLVALALRLIRRGGQAPVSTFFAGFAVLALLLARQPTAAGLGIVLAIFVIASLRPGPILLMRLIIWSAAGMAAYLAVMALLVEPPWRTWDRLQGGLVLLEALQRDADHGAKVARMVERVISITADWWWALVVTAIAMAVAVRPDSRRPWLAWSGVCVFALATLGALGGWFMEVRGDVETVGPFQFQAPTLLGLLAIAGAVGRLAGSLGCRQWRVEAWRLGLVMTILAAGVSVFFLTGNPWLPRLAENAAFPVLALFIAGFLPDRAQRFVSLTSLSFAIIFLQFTAWTWMAERPYRLAAPLSQQTIPTSIRHGRSQVLADPHTHAFLNALSEGAAELANCEGLQRPVLIDMTGRMPLIAYHINARPPGRSWVLSGYPGSARLFEVVLSRLDDDALQTAWILDAPGYRLRHDPDVLRSRGVDFEADYEPVAQAHTPYPDVERVVLYRPAAGCLTAQPSLSQAR